MRRKRGEKNDLKLVNYFISYFQVFNLFDYLTKVNKKME